MIAVDGYLAFRGEMKIRPRSSSIEPFKISGDWLYKPEFDCWYGGGRSFSAEICEIIYDDTCLEVKPNE